MKERQILFNGGMVRAILDGRKTQTRRVIKPQPYKIDCGTPYLPPVPDDTGCSFAPIPCPFGHRRDRLYVREATAWLPDGDNADPKDGRWVYRADGEMAVKWTPSIHMPRAASRITLEITDVRVERLQDISEADASAEGAFFAPNSAFQNSFKQGFENLWQSINGQASWDSNPWVWVVEFKKIKGE